jgi:uncharacterized damage-inducible protein DinB
MLSPVEPGAGGTGTDGYPSDTAGTGPALYVSGVSSPGAPMAALMDPAAFLSYWQSVRARTRRVAERIPAEHIEWSPAPGRWSFGDLLRHLGGIERGMYAETAAGRPSAYPGHGPELAAGKEAVLAYLDRCHAETATILAGLSPEAFAGRSVTPAGASITTWKWLRAMVEHEAHHRG